MMELVSLSAISVRGLKFCLVTDNNSFVQVHTMIYFRRPGLRPPDILSMCQNDMGVEHHVLVSITW